MQSTFMAWHGSIHYSEEGRRGQDNIQCWEDEVEKKTSCLKMYKELFANQDELFDVYAEVPEIRKKLEKVQWK